MNIGIPQEIFPGERRVAATPELVKRLLTFASPKGEVFVEAGAGSQAGFSDAKYEMAGAKIVSTQSLWDRADVILKVRPLAFNDSLGVHESTLLRQGATLASFFWPAQNPQLLDALKSRDVTVLAMDQVPRLSRAQSMDALSSMANLAGYRAIIEAAQFFPGFFTGQMTAAGKIPPARVLVIGAGVAGLAAIGAARALGAVVQAFDTRAEVKEQIQSMGAEFLTVEVAEEGSGQGGYAKTMSAAYLEAELALFAKLAPQTDIIVSTALVPGKKAPTLITEAMVRSMRPGSVIVDLAAEQGGNCALTTPGRVAEVQGIQIVGYTDLPSRMATHASQLYGTNVFNLLVEVFGKDGQTFNQESAITRSACIVRDGQVCWPPPAQSHAKTQASAPKVVVVANPPQSGPPAAKHGHSRSPKSLLSRGKVTLIFALSAVLAIPLGLKAPPEFLQHLTVFALAVFVGWQLIWSVAPALHTPLMSVTNAISGIIVIGAMLQMTGSLSDPAVWLAGVAILVATINIAGGFLVTQRMLRMFQR